ncbi:hypothetical protein HPP92_004370 [Vanilla planifolia]|uniref:Uncharacterized protein n=1 Tax=Vanilla planifolia TaxID=51239 RepID=A0A835VEE9_VANPL|nr:hypothetical protein HPP92_004370 [Vanilla planifolia]
MRSTEISKEWRRIGPSTEFRSSAVEDDLSSYCAPAVALEAAEAVDIVVEDFAGAWDLPQ